MQLEEGDIALHCRDCKQAFAFTKGEQEFYATCPFKSLKRKKKKKDKQCNDAPPQPSRCKPCNAAKKALERGAEAARQARMREGDLIKVKLMREGDLIKEPEARMLTEYGGSEIQYIQ